MTVPFEKTASEVKTRVSIDFVDEWKRLASSGIVMSFDAAGVLTFVHEMSSVSESRSWSL